MSSKKQPILLPNGQIEKDLIGMNLKVAKDLILAYNPTFKVEFTAEMYQYKGENHPDFVRLFYKSNDYSTYDFDTTSVVTRVERY